MLPRRRPNRSQGRSLPRPYERSRKRILLKVFAKFLSDRVHPNVGGYIVRSFVRAKDMVIVVFLPKPHASFLLKEVRGFLFIAFGEREQITGWLFPKDKEMQVVGHDTICVH